MRLEGQKGSAPVVMESKFYSSCYMSPLKDLKQKAKKKKCHFLVSPVLGIKQINQKLSENKLR